MQRGAPLFQGNKLVGFASLYVSKQKYAYLNLSQYLYFIDEILSASII